MRAVQELGVEVAVVVGGGNIIRGEMASQAGIDRTAGPLVAPRSAVGTGVAGAVGRAVAVTAAVAVTPGVGEELADTVGDAVANVVAAAFGGALVRSTPTGKAPPGPARAAPTARAAPPATSASASAAASGKYASGPMRSGRRPRQLRQKPETGVLTRPHSGHRTGFRLRATTAQGCTWRARPTERAIPPRGRPRRTR